MRNHQFGALLSEGIASVATRCRKTRPGIRWEITEHLRQAGFVLYDSTVAGWCQGFVPREPAIITWLTRYCVNRGRVNRQWAKSLLQHARYPEREPLLDELFPGAASQMEGQSDAQEPSSLHGSVVRVRDPLLPLRPALPSGGLVGRATLSGQLKQQLLPGARLALHGLPGVGKTALALELAHDRQMHARFPDGVLWAGLGPHPNLLGLLLRWGELPGLASAANTSQANVEGAIERLRGAVGERRLLVLLDDAWALEDALTCQVGGPNCGYLLTTRFSTIALGFADQMTFPVPELSEQDGLDLLLQWSPHLAQAEQQELRALVRAVGGLPLALRLLGKYLQVEAYSGQPRRVQMALTRLQDAAERLSLAQPQAPLEAQHSVPTSVPLSLMANIATSYYALHPRARTLLLALSVFPAKPNSFSEEAALMVGAASLKTLDTLVDAGLLESSGPGRYQVHQTIADFARLKGVQRKPKERLAAFFARYAEAHQTDYDGLDQESTNIFTALQLAFDQGWHAAVIQGANALARFLETRGCYEEAETLLTRARQAATTVPEPARLASVLLNLGRMAGKRGDYARAEACLQEGLLLARQTGSLAVISDLLLALGSVCGKRGDAAQAERYYQESLALARQIGYQENISLLLRHLGAAAHRRGEYLQAEACYQEALPLARQMGQTENIGSLLTNLGVVALSRGAYAQAEGYLQEGLTLARHLTHRESICLLLTNLGQVAFECGDLSQATCYYEEAVEVARQIGHRELLAVALVNLGEIAGRQGEYGQAEERLQAGWTLANQIGHRFLMSYALEQWGQIHLKQGRFEQATATFAESLALARQVQGQEVMALALYGLAQVSAAQGQVGQARQHAEASLGILEAMGNAHRTEVGAWLSRLPPALDA
jgi:tetratricopeptide (TPR) repeat protein